MWSLKVFDHQPVSSSLCESVWPITSFFMTFHKLLDLSSPQVFSKWLHKSSFQKGSKKGKNIQVVHGSHVQPTRLRATPLAPCHITTYEPWRKNCHISTDIFTIQIPCIYVILSWFLVASHTQLWLNRYVTPAKLWARFKLSLCVRVCWRLRGNFSLNTWHMKWSARVHGRSDPPTHSLATLTPRFKSHPDQKKILNFNTKYSGAPHEHEKECFSKLHVSVCAVLQDFLQMLSCSNHFGWLVSETHHKNQFGEVDKQWPKKDWFFFGLVLVV